MTAHIHTCIRDADDDYCASRGYCECRCGAWQGYSDDEWSDALATDRPATLSEVLRSHWITSLDCDHNTGTDTARCFCTVWTGTPQPSVGQAVSQWADHVCEMLSISRTITASPVLSTLNPKQ